MTDRKKRNVPTRAQGTVDKYEPGGALGPIKDGSAYERGLDSLSAEQKELAGVCARFADVCDYFSRQNMDLPPQILDEIGRVSKLSVPDRIAAMNRLNQGLMEYLHDVGQDSRIRQ